MRIAGIDEAGRGSVIGPLVIVGVLFDEKKIPLLKENNFDLNNPDDRNGDKDNDGYTNLEEYLNSLVTI